MPVSKKQQACVRKYSEAHYDRINLVVPKGDRDKLKEYAEARGMSMNGLISVAVEEYMNNHK